MPVLEEYVLDSSLSSVSAMIRLVMMLTEGTVDLPHKSMTGAPGGVALL